MFVICQSLTSLTLEKYIFLLQVIWCTLLSILIPILVVGTTTKNNGRFNIFTFSLNIITSIIHPILLHFRLAASKIIKKKLILLNDARIDANLKEIIENKRELERDLLKETRLYLGLETIFQVAGNTVLLFFAKSSTKTSQGLSSLLEKNTSAFMGLTFPSEVVIAVLLAVNLLSFINVHINGMVEGYASNYNLLGKLTILLGIIGAVFVRITSILLYFSTSLGLLNMLRHYQGRLE